MNYTDKTKRDLRPIDPNAVAAPIPEAGAFFGWSRSFIYRAAAAGQITMRKAGRTTLVDMASARALYASLPAAKVGATGKAA